MYYGRWRKDDDAKGYVTVLASWAVICMDDDEEDEVDVDDVADDVEEAAAADDVWELCLEVCEFSVSMNF